MTKSQLRAYRDVRRERDQLLRMIENLETLLYGPRTSRLDGMPRAGSMVDDGRREALMERHGALLARYALKIEELDNQINTIEDAITALPSKHRTVCRLYYIEGRTWQQVCNEMHYSWDRVHQFHREALAKLREV